MNMLRIILFIRNFVILLAAIQPITCWSGTGDAKQVIQLASIYHSGISIKEYWISEKLDGVRARWDGKQLLTRNGNVIQAPGWFVQAFPQQALDGELWVARNSFELTTSIVLRDIADDRWQQVKLMLFDLPDGPGSFSQRLDKMEVLVAKTASPYLQMIPQFRLDNEAQLTAKLDSMVAQGAEGLMLHHQDAYYQDGRSDKLLKLKKYQDAEATVIEHLPGKGKYQNMLGALLVELQDGTQFKIGSGFSDLQRQNPPPIGSAITFKYYGKTVNGLPRFASFMRVREDQ
ncbi:DNA ligase [Neptunicella sp. SCSIO 80796]|uniref:DNA ligase n=1 Tax=Neptunicella plasticusilytica TaxID=3117012 RepID=UPI003A4D9576